MQSRWQSDVGSIAAGIAIFDLWGFRGLGSLRKSTCLRPCLFLLQSQTSAAKIDWMLGIMAASLEIHNNEPLFRNHQGVYRTIDKIPICGVLWQLYTFTYDGLKPVDAPKWMDAEYTLWYQDLHNVFLKILTLRNHSITHLIGSTMWREIVSMSTSCQE